MESKKLFPIFHPKVSYWMRKNKLNLIGPNQYYGFLAQPLKNEDTRFLFSGKNKYDEIERLSGIYGTRFHDSLLKVSSHFSDKNAKKTLESISEEVLKVGVIHHISDPSIFIGGITVPDRKYIYIEYLGFGRLNDADCLVHKVDSIPIKFI